MEGGLRLGVLNGSKMFDPSSVYEIFFFKSGTFQESELIRLVTSRHDLARLTGFESFAHRAQHNSVLGTYDNVKEFLHLLIEVGHVFLDFIIIFCFRNANPQ